MAARLAPRSYLNRSPAQLRGLHMDKMDCSRGSKSFFICLLTLTQKENISWVGCWSGVRKSTTVVNPDNPKIWDERKDRRQISKMDEHAQRLVMDRTGLDAPTLLHFPVTFDSGRWDNVRLMGQKEDKYLLFRPACLPSKSLHYLTSPLIWQEREKATHWRELVSDW